MQRHRQRGFLFPLVAVLCAASVSRAEGPEFDLRVAWLRTASPMVERHALALGARLTLSLEPVPPLPMGAAGSRLTAPGVAPPPAPPRRLPRRLLQGALRAALRHAGLEGDAGLISLASRARSSAALPEVTVRGGRTTDASLRLSPTLDDPYRYTQGDSASLVLEGKLHWRLHRLAFASEEVQIERLRAERRKARAELIQAVVAQLVRWQRATAVLEDPAQDVEGRAAAEQNLAEAEIRLDALTGGWFGEELERRHRGRSTGAAAGGPRG